MQFSELEPPHPRVTGNRKKFIMYTSAVNCKQELTALFINLHVQHTPNPEAQEPALSPPLLEHSSLKSFSNCEDLTS